MDEGEETIPLGKLLEDAGWRQCSVFRPDSTSLPDYLEFDAQDGVAGGLYPILFHLQPWSKCRADRGGHGCQAARVHQSQQSPVEGTCHPPCFR